MKAKVVIPVIALFVVAGLFLLKGHRNQLPTWAPQNPSPEFVNAAKVLTSLPTSTHSGSPLDVAIWECFGGLTDQQIETFTKTGNIDVKVVAMSATQRKAFNEILKDNQVQSALAQAGAAQDLSNVDVAFIKQAQKVAVTLTCSVANPQMPNTPVYNSIAIGSYGINGR